MNEIDVAIERWHATFIAAGRTSQGGGEFPPHSGQCLGCGPDNAHGYRLEVTRHGNLLRAKHTFDRRHEGAPGIAHGGAVAAVLDDIAGKVPYLKGDMAVTRRLTVDYHAPVQLGTAYVLTSWLERREGRKLVIHAEARDGGQLLVCNAVGVFASVSVDHFRDIGGPARRLAERSRGEPR